MATGMFVGCTSLKTVSVNGDIGHQAFEGCTSLEKINIKKACYYINQYCFKDCPALTKINYEGSEEEWNKIWKDSSVGEYLKNISVTYNVTIS